LKENIETIETTPLINEESKEEKKEKKASETNEEDNKEEKKEEKVEEKKSEVKEEEKPENNKEEKKEEKIEESAKVEAPKFDYSKLSSDIKNLVESVKKQKTDLLIVEKKYTF